MTQFKKLLHEAPLGLAIIRRAGAGDFFCADINQSFVEAFEIKKPPSSAVFAWDDFLKQVALKESALARELGRVLPIWWLGETNRIEVKKQGNVQFIFIRTTNDAKRIYLIYIPNSLPHASWLLTVSERFICDIEELLDKDRLFKSLVQFEKLIDTSTDAIQIADENGRMVYINDEAAKRLGINKDLVKEYFVWDFEPLFSVPGSWNQHVEELQQRGKQIIQSTNKSIDSRNIYPVEVTVSYQNIDGVGYVVASSRDITDRVETTNALNRQGILRDILMKLSSDFINMPLNRVHDSINNALKELGTFVDADRAYIFDYNFKANIAVNTFEWCAEGIIPQIDYLQEVPVNDIDDWVNTHLQGKPMMIMSVNGLEDGYLKELLLSQEIKNLLTIPLMNNEECLGFVGFDSVHQEHTYTLHEQQLLTVFSQMLVYVFERTRYEYTLKQTRDFLNTTGRIASIGGWEWDVDRQLFKLSAVGAEILHLNDSRSLSFHEAIGFVEGEKGKALLTTRLEQLMANDSGFEIELLLRPQNTEPAWFRIIGRVNEAEGKKRYYGTLQNIDAITKAQNELDRTKQEMASILNEMEDVVCAYSLPDFKLKFTTPSIKDLLEQKSFDEAEAGPLLIHYLHPEDAEKIKNRIFKTDVLRHFSDEVRLILPNKSLKWIKMKAKVVKESGEASRLDVFISDNTFVRSAQEENNRARREAELANKAKSEFLANMSHEIRTPLNGVIGFTELLENTKLNSEQQQYVQNANTSAHLLLGIINDILDFSKIESGKLELEQLKVNLPLLIEETADIVKYHASKKGIEFLVRTPPQTPTFIWTDPVRLKQILVNLLSNALKFTSSGEIELSLELLAAETNEARIQFAVRDTGIGISKENQGKLFKVFSQADSSTTRKFGGTGLGLVISNMLAEKMGGRISLQSEVGKGSTFSFSIRVPYEYGEKDTLPDLQDIKNVLIIDDNENNRLILKNTLNHWGINTHDAENGLQAIQILANEEPFQAIIVDYNMPYIDGIETIRLIRDKSSMNREELPVLLLHSSAEDQQLIENCKALGIHTRITKPVKASELKSALIKLRHPDYVQKLVDQVVQEDAPHPTISKTILLAEDVEMNTILIRVLLKKLMPGVQLIEAGNGAIAVQMAAEHMPDLILMDVQMPEKDGYSAAMEIRLSENEKLKQVPIIALTAGALKGERERCLDAGMNDYLTKPIDSQMLKETLEKYLK